MTDVLVFVPGGLGSELWDENEQIWPPTTVDGVLGGYDSQGFQRLLKPSLEPKRIVRKVLFVSVYDGWIKAFEKVARNGKRLFTEELKTLWTAPYDWRKSVADGAKRLDQQIKKALAAHAGADIHIVAHSLGGLVARYYLQCGAYEIGCVKSLITLGTPHKGAPVALAAALGLHKVVLLTLAQTQTMANDPNFPALYEIFPARGEPVLWRQQKILPDDFYVGNAAAKLQLSKGHLGKALSLQKVLSRPLPKDVRIFQFVGTQFDTITHFLWDGQHPPQRPEMSKEAGDGTVPAASAMHGQQTRCTGREHGQLMLAPEALESFAAYFEASPGAFAMGAGDVTISVRELSFEEGDAIDIVLQAAPNDVLEPGTLTFEHADADVSMNQQAFVASGRASISVTIESPGAVGTRLSLSVKANLTPGVYRPVFQNSAGRNQPGPAFIVKAKAP